MQPAKGLKQHAKKNDAHFVFAYERRVSNEACTKLY